MTTNRKRHEKVNSHSFKLHRSYSISFNWHMLAKFSRVESERSVSKFRRGKRQLPCCVHLLHKAGACEIRKFHVAGVQRRQRNLQNSMLHVQICFCFFVNKNLYFFATLLPSPSLVLLLSRNSATMVM